MKLRSSSRCDENFSGEDRKLEISSQEIEMSAVSMVQQSTSTMNDLPKEIDVQAELNDLNNEIIPEGACTPQKRKVEGIDAGTEDVGIEEQTFKPSIHRKMQKKLNKQQAKMGAKPCFMLSRDHNKLSVKDLRDLILYLLTETKTLPWIMVKNKFNINKVVVLYVPGLDPTFFNIDLKDPDSKKPILWTGKAKTGPVTEFQHLQKFFDVMNVMKAGGDKYRVHSPVESILSVSLSNSERQKREQEMKKKKKDASKFKPEYYMMGLEQLREHDFPLPSYLDPKAETEEGWIETKLLKAESPAPKKMIAMDCEMCRTTGGSELTRISLINEKGENIYDELVMPDNEIVDYLTQYSGMTAERLAGVKTRLSDVQAKLQELITYDTILFAHPFIIDTTVVYHHTRGPPFRASLKWLAQKWLSRKIQQGGEHGHNSEEDARACMDLVKLKIREGPGFGEYNQDQESIFSRIARHTSPRTSAVIDSDIVYGQSFATTVIKTQSDEEVVKAIPLAIQQHNLVWGRLRAMDINYGKAPGKDDAGHLQIIDTSATPNIRSECTIEVTEEEVREAVRSIDNHIADIVESLPESTALIVTSGQGDIRDVQRMQARQKTFQRLYNTLNLSAIPKEDQFLEEDQKALEEAVDKAKNGVCFFMVK
ncbi:hypothetical protein BGZ49_000402 [Haplosporangium sp. Z 27]|nr:hypothetical protein BGZ49_000402 [Haplosporangium sp. Z 27]